MKRKTRRTGRGKVVEFLPDPKREPSEHAKENYRMPLADWLDMWLKADVEGAIPPAVADRMEMIRDGERAMSCEKPRLNMPEAQREVRDIYATVMEPRPSLQGPEIVKIVRER